MKTGETLVGTPKGNLLERMIGCLNSEIIQLEAGLHEPINIDTVLSVLYNHFFSSEEKMKLKAGLYTMVNCIADQKSTSKALEECREYFLSHGWEEVEKVVDGFTQVYPDKLFIILQEYITVMKKTCKAGSISWASFFICKKSQKSLAIGYRVAYSVQHRLKRFLLLGNRLMVGLRTLTPSV